MKYTTIIQIKKKDIYRSNHSHVDKYMYDYTYVKLYLLFVVCKHLLLCWNVKCVLEYV